MKLENVKKEEVGKASQAWRLPHLFTISYILPVLALTQALPYSPTHAELLLSILSGLN